MVCFLRRVVDCLRLFYWGIRCAVDPDRVTREQLRCLAKDSDWRIERHGVAEDPTKEVALRGIPFAGGSWIRLTYRRFFTDETWREILRSRIVWSDEDAPFPMLDSNGNILVQVFVGGELVLSGFDGWMLQLWQDCYNRAVWAEASIKVAPDVQGQVSAEPA